MANPYFDKSELLSFDENHNTEHEDDALHARAEFLEFFPKKSLPTLTLNDYVIGLDNQHFASLDRPTFCKFVEVETRYWARITGATAFKFGIYYGRTKTDPTKRYRSAARYGDSDIAVFSYIKEALVSLVDEGSKQKLNFDRIDNNPLSPMFKAKILSLYFPKVFINICSNEHLREFASIFNLSDDLYISEIQHELLAFKNEDPVTRSWTNPRYMAFLYRKYMKKGEKNKESRPREVDWRALQDKKDARGKAAEDFAFKWERKRLKGSDLEHLVSKIENRSDRPAYGYDFLSYNSDETQRFIEVKSVLEIRKGVYRFFVSGNQKRVSESHKHKRSYYLYLVYFDDGGTPVKLNAVRANEFYQRADVDADSFVVHFKDEHP